MRRGVDGGGCDDGEGARAGGAGSGVIRTLRVLVGAVNGLLEWPF
jgi:hypothetical protein